MFEGINLVLLLLSIFLLGILINFLVKKWIKFLGKKRVNKPKSYFEAVEYSCIYRPYGKTGKFLPVISMDSASLGTFCIKTKSRFRGFWEKKGVVKDISISNKQFDEDFFVATDNTSFIEGVLQKAEALKGIRNIFNIGCSEIRQAKGRLQITSAPLKKGEEINENLLEEILKDGVGICRVIKGCNYLVEEDTLTWKKRKISYILAPAMVFLAGIILFIAGLTNYTPVAVQEPFKDSILPGLVVASILTWFGIKFFRQRSSSHHPFIAVFLISIFGWPLFFTGGKIFFNGYFDDSPASIRKVLVTGKYSSENRGVTSFFIRYSSWRQGETGTFRVGSEMYQKVKVREDLLLVSVSKGFYGYQWIKDWEIMKLMVSSD